MAQLAQQVAALPWRRGEHGLEILLVTTRTTKRWVIPKGWTMEGKADHEAAAIEAYEEAGVRGDVQSTPFGDYGYLKVLRNGKAKRVKVLVYTLYVQTELTDWPERSERQRKWFDQQHALSLVGEPELIPVFEIFFQRNRHEVPNQKSASPDVSIFKRWWRRIVG